MPAQDELGRRLALIVASSDYRDPALQQLRAPGRDASDLAEVLGDPAIGTFQVRTLINTPSDQLLRGIARFCHQPGPGDLVLVYLSCHGLLDDRGRLYYATIDTERTLLSATAMSAQWLNDQLEDCRARRQILLLDCCHSGAFAKGSKGDDALALKDRFSGRGKVVVTASGATEYSFEGATVVGEDIQSVFTRAVVDGLRTGQADRDKDGLVTVNDLYNHVYDTVRAAEPRQTPKLWAFGAEGDLLVAHSPRGPVIEPAPLPDDVRVLIESPRTVIRESGVKALADLLDHGEPGLALTARLTLQRISEEDLPRIAVLAQTAHDAGPGQAVAQLEAQERARREAEEQARRREAERAAAQRQQQIEQLQAQMRDHAAAQDWDAVLAASDQLAALDPAAADPDALAATAREQITRRQQAAAESSARDQTAERSARLGELLRIIAEAQRLSPADLSKRLPGWSNDAIEAYLAGARRPEWDFVTAFLDVVAENDPDRREVLERQLRQGWEATGLRGQAEHADQERQQEEAPAFSQLSEGITSTIPLDLAPRQEAPRPPGRSPARHFIPRRGVIIGALIAVVGVIATITIVLASGASNVPSSNPPVSRTSPAPSSSPASGDLRWTYTTGGYVDSSPAVADGTVYVGSQDDKVYALDAATGRLRWTYTTGGGVVSSPAVADGTVYVGSNDYKVYALDAATGRLRWTYTTGGYVHSSPAVADGTVYVGSQDDKVYALDAATGHLRWTYTTGEMLFSSPAVADGTVYVSNDNGQVYALDAASGQVRWTYTTGTLVNSYPAVAGGTVYVGSDDDNVYALDAATGHLRWTYLTGGGVVSSPAVAGGTVYVGSDDHKVYALDAATGHLRWTYTTGTLVNSYPAVSGGTVYVGSEDGQVYALDAASGQFRWTYTTGGYVNSSPAVAGGTVYVGSDYKLYALTG